MRSTAQWGTRLRATPLWTLGLLLFAASARADAPAGAYTLELEPSAALGLAQGDAELCDAGGFVGCSTSSVATDDAGAIIGAGAIALSDVSYAFDLTYTLAGQLGGSPRTPKARADLAAAGTLQLSGGPAVDVTGTGKLACEIDQLDDTRFACTAKLKLCGTLEEKRYCRKAALPVALALVRVPVIVYADLATGDDARVTGDADLFLGAAPIHYDVTGKYKQAIGLVNLAFTGADPALKTKLSISGGQLTVAGGAGGLMKLKVAGQKGRGEFVPNPVSMAACPATDSAATSSTGTDSLVLTRLISFCVPR